jgi:hypothetical protein
MPIMPTAASVRNLREVAPSVVNSAAPLPYGLEFTSSRAAS